MKLSAILDIDAERDVHQLPVSDAVRAVVDRGDRLVDDLLHSDDQSSPLLPVKPLLAVLSSTRPIRNGETYRAYARRVMRHEVLRIVELFVPILLSSLAETLADMSLPMLIGHTSIGADTRVLAALTITGTYPSMPLSAVTMGVVSAVDTLCAQAFGGRRLAELWLFFQAGLLVSTLLLPCLVAISVSAAPVLQWFGQDPEIVATCRPIILVIASSLPSQIISSLAMSALRAQGVAMPGVMASAVAWAVSTPIVWWLAFSTRLGYVGIAMSTTLTYTVKSAILVVAMLRSPAFAAAWPGWQPRAAWVLAWEMKALVGSGILLMGFSTMGVTIFSMITGLLPDAAMAVTASGIFLSMFVLASVPLDSLASAGAVRIGNALGSNQSEQAQVLAQGVIIASVGLGLVQMLVSSALATPFARVFTSDSDAAELAARMIQVLSPMLIATGLASGAQAALSAMGEQFVSALVSFVGVVVVGVPVGCWLAMVMDGGIVGLWSGNVVGFALCAVAQLVWLWRLDWAATARTAAKQTQLDQRGDAIAPFRAAVAA